MTEHIDFATAKELTTAISYLYDPDTTREPGNILRYVLLEQVTSEQCELTSYMVGNTWYRRKVTSFGVVGTKFLLDGEDLKSRLSNDVWRRNGLRLKSTNRNMIRLECMNGWDDIPHVESGTYTGDSDLFVIPDIEWKPLTVLTDGWSFRRACNYTNTFSKCRGDTNNKVVWFNSSAEDTVNVFCTEHTGKSGISYIMCQLLRQPNETEINFGVSARHLPKLHTVFDQSVEVTILVDDLQTPTTVKFEGDVGFIILPTVESFYCKAVSEVAPEVMANPELLALNHEAQRIFDLKKLYEGLLIQVPKKKADSEDLLLQDTDEVKLTITKQADVLQRDRSSLQYAKPDGLDTKWEPLVVNYQYFKACLETLLKYSKDQTAEQSYEAFDYESDFDDFQELDEWALQSTDSSTILVTLTQAWLRKSNRWCLYIDPVPYNNSCRTFLSARTPLVTTDRLQGD